MSNYSTKSHISMISAVTRSYTLCECVSCCLDEVGKIIQNLVQNIRYLENLHTQLADRDRTDINNRIRLLRIGIDHEITEFHELRQQAMKTSSDENISLTNNDHPSNDRTDESTVTSTNDELVRSQVTTSPNFLLNHSYNSLEQDLIVLQETINKVAQLVAEQKQTLSYTENLIETAHDHTRIAASLLQRTVRNKYFSLATGALIGASFGGPVGFLMGMKIGTLAALSGSAVGVLSMNRMQTKIIQHEQLIDTTMAYSQAML
jgi:hypothetical protein